jgi:hypothetical protein
MCQQNQNAYCAGRSDFLRSYLNFNYLSETALNKFYGRFFWPDGLFAAMPSVKNLSAGR